MLSVSGYLTFQYIDKKQLGSFVQSFLAEGFSTLRGRKVYITGYRLTKHLLNGVTVECNPEEKLSDIKNYEYTSEGLQKALKDYLERQ